jgi:uncharacterized protein with ParB-like and HNH nuclease domain
MNIDNVGHHPLKFLFNSENEQLLIPPYQRRYSWDVNNWKDLLLDLESLKEDEKHFFGSIVFIGRTHVHGINPLEIIDGQQRITTVSILLSAIRGFFKDKENLDKSVENIERCLWVMDHDGIIGEPKLILGNLDNDSYKNLLNGNFEDIKNPRIRKAYDFFLNYLKDKNLESVKKLRDKILTGIVYVNITVKGDKDAYHLFETMNNRGLPLNPVDLIKNYLFMISSEKDDLNSERVKELWTNIIKNLDGLSEITFFRQYFMASKLVGMNNKISENQIYPEFKKILGKCDNIGDLLEDIKIKSELYGKLLNSKIDNFDKGKNVEINALLEDVKNVSITPFTLLLRAFSELENANDLLVIMEICNALLVRRNICRLTTGTHDTYFNHLAQTAFTRENFLDYIKSYFKEDGDKYPDDEVFINNFFKHEFGDNNKTRYYLGVIEEKYFCHGGYKINKSGYGVHIEHIFPFWPCKTLNEIWLKPLNVSEEDHKKFRNRIGNLTLLESGENIPASNKKFSEKKKYYEKSDFKMIKELLEYNSWDLDKIDKRSKELAKIAAKVWSF